MAKFLPSGKSFDGTSILPNVFAGLVAGIVTLVYSISFTALIFSGSLVSYFPQGLGIALIGATLTSCIVASRSAFPFALAGPESNSVVLLALMSGTIAHTLNLTGATEQTYPTVWIAIAFSTVLTGLFLFTLGSLQLGQWARFIPYPVIGGFLAGTGWLITRSSFNVMVGFPLNVEKLPDLVQGPVLLPWLIGLGVALTLLLTLRRFKHFFVLPGLLLGLIVCFDIVWWFSDRFLFKIEPNEWFFEPFSVHDLWQFWQFSTLLQVNWGVLLQQSGTVTAMMIIVVISILLNATSLELATSKNVDLNRELQVNGIANLVAGLCGGSVGYLSINRSLLNHQAGANRPLAGIISGLLCAFVLLFGSSFLAYLPKPILGGVLLYIGLGLLIRWGYQAWFQFPHLDYALILLILVIVATWGFLQGVGAGIVISCFLFILNYGRTPVIKHKLSGATSWSTVQRSLPQQQLLKQKGNCIEILVLQGFIFFGTANTLLDGMLKRLSDPNLPTLKFIILDFRLVSGLDSSAILSFTKMSQIAQKYDLDLIFTNPQPFLQKQLQFIKLIESESRVCYVFNTLDQGIEWCENQILEISKFRRPRLVPLSLQLKSIFPNPELVSQLMHYLQPVKLNEGDYLFQQGEPFNGLYFLEFGRLSVVVELADGSTERICAYTGINTIGEIAFYQQSQRSATVIADQPSSLYFLSTEALALIETHEPKLAASFHKFIVTLLAERLKNREEELRSLLQ